MNRDMNLTPDPAEQGTHKNTEMDAEKATDKALHEPGAADTAAPTSPASIDKQAAQAAETLAATKPAGGRRGGMGHGGMGGPPAKPVNFGPSLKRLLATMRPERTVFIIVVVMGVLAVVGSVVGPKLIGVATDIVFAGIIGAQLPAGASVDQLVQGLRAAGKDTFADMLANMPYVVPGQGIDYGLLGRWLGLAVGIYLASAVLKFFQNYLLNAAVQRTIYRLREATRAKLDRLPLAYFDRQPRGELLSRMTNDTDNLAQVLQQSLGQLLSALLLVIGVVGMMFYVSPLLALVTMATLPFIIGVSILIGKKAQVQFADMWKHTGELNGIIEESYSGHGLVKVFGRKREVARHMQLTNDKLYDSALRAQVISGMLMPVNMFIGSLGYVLIAVVGGLQVASGKMPLGNVQAFIMYSRMFTQPLTQIASMANLLQSGVASAERIFQVLDAPEMVVDESGIVPTQVAGEVVFDDVTFSYVPSRPLIEGLNLHVKPGETVAIVGPTGAGKTTLVNLLERFYDLDGGRILLDGTDISTLSRSGLRSHFGMVLQDAWLFGGTIRDNIAYGKHGATDEEIITAAKAAHVDHFVHQLPDGYDTIITEEGTNISAGERQLITIARAFVARPDVLILDEATSSVDTRTELLVQRAMNRLRQGRTSFVIAHRLSTIRNADVIIVMEDGAIVEKGNHDELMKAEGPYYRLYQSQFEAALS